MDRGRYILQLLHTKEKEAAEAVQNIDNKEPNSVNWVFEDRSVCESAPQSVITDHKGIPNMEPPNSAPQLTNIPNDLFTLQDVVAETLQNYPSCINNNVSPSQSSHISGVERLSSSPRPDPYADDSSDSWIPNSDEEPYVRNRTLLISTSSNDSFDSQEPKNATPTHAVFEDLPPPSPQTNYDIEDSPPPPQTNHGIEDLPPLPQTDHDVEPNPKRWKKSDPSKWKKNVSKRNMYNCLPYENKTGKIMRAKLPKPVKCDIKCRYKCTSIFDEADRMQICKSYWNLNSFSVQRQFLLSKITTIPIKRIKVGIPNNKHRSISYGYYFEKDNTKHRVCKDFFIKTLSISNGPINEAMKHRDQVGNYIGQDKRGNQTPINKTNPDAERQIVDHINSFPRLESHYCRKKSKRQYLDCKLSIVKMYQLYKEKLESENKEPCSLFVYKRIFGTQFNLSFYTPKKDLCLLCTKYDNSGRLEELKEEYDAHIARKNECQIAKEADKERSITDPTYLVVTADMQSTLQIPVSGVGVLYYTRKLNVQNYTIHTAKPPNDAYCIIWNEVNGKRGSVEIATAINWWITQIPDTVKEVTVYSDTCAGQNRNQFIAAFLLHLIQRSDNNLEIFEQKYLESGHTHMEVDSMHSAIEKEQRHSAVYSMIDWKSIMTRARSKRHKKSAPPYNVQELLYSDMLDVRSINEAFIKNTTKDENGNRVMWLKIKCLRFVRRRPGIIEFRYSHTGPYLELDVLKSEERQVRTRTKNKQGQDVVNDREEQVTRDAIIKRLKEFPVPKAYLNALPISEAKKKDLISLCKKGIIPHELHHWYNSLPQIKQLLTELANLTRNMMGSTAKNFYRF